VGLVESVTVTVTGLEPALGGVPEITPVDEFIVRLAGSPLADQVYDCVPPAAATVNEYAPPTLPSDNAAVVIESAAEIVIVKCFVTHCCGAYESHAVTSTEMDAAAAGVPAITPVDALIERVAGRPVADHVYEGIPPAAAKFAEYADVATPPGREEVTMDNAGPTVRGKSLLTEMWFGLAESVSVT
jgi:hypothetical protein